MAETNEGIRWKNYNWVDWYFQFTEEVLYNTDIVKLKQKCIY